MTRKTRNIIWRGLVRLMTVGISDTISVDINKEACLRKLRALCGHGLCPSEDKFNRFDTHFDAFACILSQYIGAYISKDAAVRMFVNPRNRGYQHSSLFWDTLGDLPWPPGCPLKRQPTEVSSMAQSTRKSCFKRKNIEKAENTPPAKRQDVFTLWDWNDVEREMCFS
jgi:hypothetical protein